MSRSSHNGNMDTLDFKKIFKPYYSPSAKEPEKLKTIIRQPISAR